MGRTLGENFVKPQVAGNILSCSDWDSNLGSDRTQQAVSGNALDH